jgi:Ca2+-transporting ATPase
MQNWHTLKIEDLIHELGTDLAKGQSPEESARRLEQYGPNELVERGVTSPWKILWEQFLASWLSSSSSPPSYRSCSKNTPMPSSF